MDSNELSLEECLSEWVGETEWGSGVDLFFSFSRATKVVYACTLIKDLRI